MKHIIALSGGIDSAAILYDLASKADIKNIVSVFFNCGQKAAKQEMMAVRNLSANTKTRLIEIGILDIFCRSNSRLITSNKKPVTETVRRVNGTEHISTDTEIEFRNGVMLSACTSLAMQLFPGESVTIYYGAAKTREPYPDCSLVFTEYMNLLSSYVSGGKVSVKAPLLNMGKDEIVDRAKALSVPINDTWSCYEGAVKPCGICSACLDRKVAGVFYDNRQG